MQNLLWKFTVLAGVIGVSCLVVWQAHVSLQTGPAEPNPAEFTALQVDGEGEEYDPVFDLAQTAPLGQLEPPRSLDEPEPTLAPGLRSEAEPQPTLAGEDSPGTTATLSPQRLSATYFPSHRRESADHPAGHAGPRGFPASTGNDGGAPPQGEEPEAAPPAGAQPSPFLPLAALDQGHSRQPESEPRDPFPQPEPLEEADLPPQSERTLSREDFSPIRPLGVVDERETRPDHRAAAETAPESEQVPGLTRLPPSNPGPVLLTPRESLPHLDAASEPEDQITTADGTDEHPGNVQPAAGDVFAENPFLSSHARPPRDVAADDRRNGPAEPDEVLPLMPVAGSEEPSEFENPFAAGAPPRGDRSDRDFEPVLPPESGFDQQPESPRIDEGTNPFAPRPSAPAQEEPASRNPGPSGGAAEPIPLPPPSIEKPQPADSLPWPAASEPTPAPSIAAPGEDVLPLSDPSDWPSGPQFDPAVHDAAEPLPADEVLPRITPKKSTEEQEPRVQPFEFHFQDPPQPERSQPERSQPESPQPEPSQPEPSQPEPSAPQGDASVPQVLPNQIDAEPVFPSGTGAAEPTPAEPPERPSPGGSQLIGDAAFDPDAPSGPQNPELTIEKVAPAEAVIGEPLIYSIQIRNVGGSDARGVVVEDRIPRGTRLEGTIPQAVLTNGKLIWELGTIPPGEQRTIQLKVVPTEAGQLGSVATVSFAAAVSATIRVTAPKLSIRLEGPSEALVGETVSYQFTVRNSGEGHGKGVFIRAILPDGLSHPGGNDLEYEVGDLAPGEARTIELGLAAHEAGRFTPHALVLTGGKTHDEAREEIRVIKSRLEIARTGPVRRFVGRPAEYVNKVTNQSGETLRDVTVLESVPRGVDLAAMPGKGHWDSVRRVISWRIAEIGPGETKEFTSQLVATLPGAHAGRLAAHDAGGNEAELATALDVMGFADLEVDLSSESRTIVVGDQLSLRLKLKNDGTAPARGVRARFEIPEGLTFVTAHGPVQFEIEGNVVQFATLEELAVSAEQSFDVILTAGEERTTKVRVSLETADYEEPIVAEERVRIIRDQ